MNAGVSAETAVPSAQESRHFRQALTSLTLRTRFECVVRHPRRARIPARSSSRRRECEKRAGRPKAASDDDGGRYLCVRPPASVAIAVTHCENGAQRCPSTCCFRNRRSQLVEPAKQPCRARIRNGCSLGMAPLARRWIRMARGLGSGALLSAAQEADGGGQRREQRAGVLAGGAPADECAHGVGEEDHVADAERCVEKVSRLVPTAKCWSSFHRRASTGAGGRPSPFAPDSRSVHAS